MNTKNKEELLSDLLSQDTKKQAHALVEIRRRQLSEFTNEVITLLDSSDPMIRGNATRTLGFIAKHHTQWVGPKLIELLTDPDSSVRGSAAETLGILSYQPAAAPLLQLLSSEKVELVRIQAAEALGYLGDPQAIPPLLSILTQHRENEEEELVRAYAASSLGLLGSSALIPTLLALIPNETERVQIDLLQACIRLGDEASISRFASRMQSWDQDLLLVGANALSFLLEDKPSAFVHSQQTRLRNLLTDVQQQYTRLAKERDLALKNKPENEDSQKIRP